MLFSNKVTVLEDCIPLNINQLFQNDYFDWYRNRKGVISKPSEGLEFIFETCLTNEEKYIHFQYREACFETYKMVDLDYKINIVSIPSNLGKGEVFYFECPETKKRARILYKAPGYLKFIHRNAFKKRISYNCQNLSKSDYAINRYWTLEKQYKELEQSIKIEEYKDKSTKKVVRLNKMADKIDYAFSQMLSNLPI